MLQASKTVTPSVQSFYHMNEKGLFPSGHTTTHLVGAYHALNAMVEHPGQFIHLLAVSSELCLPKKARKITCLNRRYLFGDILAIDEILQDSQNQEVQRALAHYTPEFLTNMKAAYGVTHLFRADFMKPEEWHVPMCETVVVERESLRPLLWQSAAEGKTIIDEKTLRRAVMQPFAPIPA